ncbi:hypothetical protein HRR83_008209 [Exophiala dermatitidis]|uniref:Uncharacterized protein n=1 Tax=Exophiala dermatitidis TaxID=5970 RepID=A0AAN6ITD7_EXODE|nr:hypothetical protein HRR74_007836 [Exophiala dermatitidis]KAJ4513638.1 hypothetical protein HRR73_005796 [Exophiala dermatitidis]KAJ4535514.1 hypothetical protein HRR77_007835 [Exophiala dermatitidis]KAJ4544441.1 hypothetical protein HRR76_002500 [Exophiala dermatitidis]KAJ4557032.1 hypothetical protein HRR79_008666 [Exophiala dermatitidis]
MTQAESTASKTTKSPILQPKDARSDHSRVEEWNGMDGMDDDGDVSMVPRWQGSVLSTQQSSLLRRDCHWARRACSATAYADRRRTAYSLMNINIMQCDVCRLHSNSIE